MQWQVLLELFASWFARIMGPLDDSRFVDFAVTSCDFLRRPLILNQLLNACLCILRAIQVLLKMVLRAYGGQL